MKNLILTVVALFFLTNMTYAQRPTLNICPLSMSMQVISESSSSICYRFTINTSYNSVEIYQDGTLIREGNRNFSFTRCFPKRPHPYDIYLECVIGCGADGCVVTIEP